MGHLRCKSPEMVQRELWVTLRAYNLIRTTTAAAAALHGKQPRQISFTGACPYVLASWAWLTPDPPAADMLLRRCQTMLAHIAARTLPIVNK